MNLKGRERMDDLKRQSYEARLQSEVHYNKDFKDENPELWAAKQAEWTTMIQAWHVKRKAPEGVSELKCELKATPLYSSHPLSTAWAAVTARSQLFHAGEKAKRDALTATREADLVESRRVHQGRFGVNGEIHALV